MREIGRGGYSVVYLARDRELDGEVALKLLVPPPAAAQVARERMRREVQAVRGLSHANIVAVFDFLEDGPWSFIVMEYVRGPDLQVRVRERGPLDADAAVRLGRDVAGALSAAHRRGILHRDVKPQNILLDPDGRARLTDFGSAKLDGQLGVTGSGTLAGTLAYTAPEVLAGRRGDARADVYALGLTLYYALTGELPERPSPHLPPTPDARGVPARGAWRPASRPGSTTWWPTRRRRPRRTGFRPRPRSTRRWRGRAPRPTLLVNGGRRVPALRRPRPARARACAPRAAARPMWRTRWSSCGARRRRSARRAAALRLEAVLPEVDARRRRWRRERRAAAVPRAARRRAAAGRGDGPPGAGRRARFRLAARGARCRAKRLGSRPARPSPRAGWRARRRCRCCSGAARWSGRSCCSAPGRDARTPLVAPPGAPPRCRRRSSAPSSRRW